MFFVKIKTCLFIEVQLGAQCPAAWGPEGAPPHGLKPRSRQPAEAATASPKPARALGSGLCTFPACLPFISGEKSHRQVSGVRRPPGVPCPEAGPVPPRTPGEAARSRRREALGTLLRPGCPHRARSLPATALSARLGGCVRKEQVYLGMKN